MKLLPLAVAMLSGTARSRLTGLTTRAKVMALFGGCALVSMVFFLSALTIVLARQVGAVAACLVMGAVFALAAVAVMVTEARRQRRLEAERMQKVAVASSAESATGAGMAMLAQAFLRGFLGGRR